MKDERGGCDELSKYPCSHDEDGKDRKTGEERRG